MSYLYRLIILIGVLFSSNAYALEFFADALYWRVTEPFDWVLTNNRVPSNQEHTYQTVSFNFDPGFRVGVSYQGDEWNSKFYYTKYYTKQTDSTSGNLTSTFLAGKAIQPPNAVFYFQSGQLDFAIDFNMFDFDLAKSFAVTESLIIQPIIGLTGGWVNQTISNGLQGELFSITEDVKNNFTGVGPKMGIEGQLKLIQMNNALMGFFANFSTAYLWGKWYLTDVLHKNTGGTFNVDLGNRHFGSLVFHAMMGANWDYHDFSMKLGYEMNDWFDQCQFFDDGTGPRNSDLILQGLTLELGYYF